MSQGRLWRAAEASIGAWFALVRVNAALGASLRRVCIADLT